MNAVRSSKLFSDLKRNMELIFFIHIQFFFVATYFVIYELLSHEDKRVEKRKLSLFSLLIFFEEENEFELV